MNEHMDTIASLAPMALGVLGFFKLFFEEPREFEKRCDTLTALCSEAIAGSFRRLLLTKRYDELERGDGNRTTDYCAEAANCVLRKVLVCSRTSTWINQYNEYYNIVLFGLVFGLLGLFISFFFQDFDLWILGLCISVVVIQVYAVFKMRSLTQRSKEDERTF